MTTERRTVGGDFDSVVMGILLKGVASRFAHTIEALRCLDNLRLDTVKDKLIVADERMKNDEDRSGGGSALQASGQQKTEKGHCQTCKV